PWCAEGGMGVRCADDVGTGSEQRMVNVVARGVDGTGRAAVGVFYFATGPDQHQLVDRRLGEWDTPVEQPEVVGKHRITGRYVAGAGHAPAQRTEDAVSERAHPFAVRSFVGNRTDSAVGLDPVKRWIGIRCHVTHGMSHSRLLKKAYLLRCAAMWMSSRKHASPLFSCDSYTSRPKRACL